MIRPLAVLEQMVMTVPPRFTGVTRRVACRIYDNIRALRVLNLRELLEWIEADEERIAAWIAFLNRQLRVQAWYGPKRVAVRANLLMSKEPTCRGFLLALVPEGTAAADMTLLEKVVDDMLLCRADSDIGSINLVNAADAKEVQRRIQVSAHQQESDRLGDRALRNCLATFRVMPEYLGTEVERLTGLSKPQRDLLLSLIEKLRDCLTMAPPELSAKYGATEVTAGYLFELVARVAVEVDQDPISALNKGRLYAQAAD